MHGGGGSDRGTRALTTPSADARPVRDGATRWGLGDVALGLAMFIGASAALVSAVLIDRRGDDREVLLDGWSLATILLINVVVFVGVPVLTSRRKGSGSLSRDYGLSLERRDVPFGLAGGFVAIVFGATAAGICTWILGAEVDTSSRYSAVAGTEQRLVLHLVVGLLVPVAEELFFRGLLLRSLLRRNGPILSLAASTALFALLHVVGAGELGAFQVAALASTAVFGLVFGGLTLGTDRRLGAAIVAHVAVNQTALLLALA